MVRIQTAPHASNDNDEDPSDGSAILERASAMVLPALSEAVAKLGPEMAGVVGYHLGTRGRNGAPANGDGGKGFRPALALLACQAVHGDPSPALPAAVAVELAHNASLIHDDIIDRDHTRRGRPAVWRVFGVPTAILAGDALFFLAVQVLAESPSLSGEGVAILATAVHQLIEGEHADLQLEGREGRTATILGDAQEMATAKTATLIAASCALGAIAGGATTDQVERLYGFGRHLGAAFQFMDDLQDIWGDPTVTGKPASDLASGKKSLPVAFALAGDSGASAELATLYRGDRVLCPDELARVADLVEAAGGRAWAAEEAERHIRKAQSLLETTACDADAAARLATLGSLITSMGARTGLPPVRR